MIVHVRLELDGDDAAAERAVERVLDSGVFQDAIDEYDADFGDEDADERVHVRSAVVVSVESGD